MSWKSSQYQNLNYLNFHLKTTLKEIQSKSVS